jgi:hypothetical protein
MIPARSWLAIGVVVLAFGAGATVQGWRLGAKVEKAETALADEKRERAEAVGRADAASLHAYTTMESTKNAAIQSAQARAAGLQADIVGLTTDRDGLRRTLAGVPARIATASRAAVDEYAATATVVFEQCTARYSELAGKADGHANDVQLMLDAWPKRSPPNGSALGG